MEEKKERRSCDVVWVGQGDCNKFRGRKEEEGRRSLL
jgi:hypothetical protein